MREFKYRGRLYTELRVQYTMDNYEQTIKSILVNMVADGSLDLVSGLRDAFSSLPQSEIAGALKPTFPELDPRVATISLDPRKKTTVESVLKKFEFLNARAQFQVGLYLIGNAIEREREEKADVTSPGSAKDGKRQTAALRTARLAASWVLALARACEADVETLAEEFVEDSGKTPLLAGMIKSAAPPQEDKRRDPFEKEEVNRLAKAADFANNAKSLTLKTLVTNAHGVLRQAASGGITQDQAAGYLARRLTQGGLPQFEGATDVEGLRGRLRDHAAASGTDATALFFGLQSEGDGAKHVDRLYDAVRACGWLAGVSARDMATTFRRACGVPTSELEARAQAVGKKGDPLLDRYRLVALEIRSTRPNAAAEDPKQRALVQQAAALKEAAEPCNFAECTRADTRYPKHNKGAHKVVRDAYRAAQRRGQNEQPSPGKNKSPVKSPDKKRTKKASDFDRRLAAAKSISDKALRDKAIVQLVTGNKPDFQ